MEDLKELVWAIIRSERYKGLKIGIITKKKVKADLQDFIESELKAQRDLVRIKHFGEITGRDLFEDYQVGIITGMHNLSFVQYAKEVERLFGSYSTAEHEYEWVELLSTQEYTYKVKNPVFKDKRVQNMFRHFCIGSTIQAIGRWRPYTAKDREFCHIFLLNNYDTGLPVRPVTKAQLLQFLGMPYVDAGKKSHVVAITALEIMKSKGKVKNSDIRERTDFHKTTISNALKDFARKMRWFRGKNHYYYDN
jgi:hypothetical protein